VPVQFLAPWLETYVSSQTQDRRDFCDQATAQPKFRDGHSVYAAACRRVLYPFPLVMGALTPEMYAARIFGITAGYHRNFSQSSYKLGRGWQFVMALLAETSGQKDVVWWAAHHRGRHRHDDLDTDIHSPLKREFW